MALLLCYFQSPTEERPPYQLRYCRISVEVANYGVPRRGESSFRIKETTQTKGPWREGLGKPIYPPRRPSDTLCHPALVCWGGSPAETKARSRPVHHQRPAKRMMMSSNQGAFHHPKPLAYAKRLALLLTRTRRSRGIVGLAPLLPTCLTYFDEMVRKIDS